MKTKKTQKTMHANQYVYMYLDSENVPFYIGKGTGNRYRPCRHLEVSNAHLYRKIRKIGLKNVRVYFLHKDISEADAFRWEKYWIKYIGRRDQGTGSLCNHTDGGEGSSQGKDSYSKEYQRQCWRKADANPLNKIRKAAYRKKFNQEHHERLIEYSRQRYQDKKETFHQYYLDRKARMQNENK